MGPRFEYRLNGRCVPDPLIEGCLSVKRVFAKLTRTKQPLREGSCGGSGGGVGGGGRGGRGVIPDEISPFITVCLTLVALLSFLAFVDMSVTYFD